MTPDDAIKIKKELEGLIEFNHEDNEPCELTPEAIKTYLGVKAAVERVSGVIGELHKVIYKKPPREPLVWRTYLEGKTKDKALIDALVDKTTSLPYFESQREEDELGSDYHSLHSYGWVTREIVYFTVDGVSISMTMEKVNGGDWESTELWVFQEEGSIIRWEGETPKDALWGKLLDLISDDVFDNREVFPGMIN